MRPRALGSRPLESPKILSQRDDPTEDEFREHAAVYAGRAREDDARKDLRRKPCHANLLAGAGGGRLNPADVRRLLERHTQTGCRIAGHPVQDVGARKQRSPALFPRRIAFPLGRPAVIARIARRREQLRFEQHLVIRRGSRDPRDQIGLERRCDQEAV